MLLEIDELPIAHTNQFKLSSRKVLWRQNSPKGAFLTTSVCNFNLSPFAFKI